jgi:hypothetical protein
MPVAKTRSRYCGKRTAAGRSAETGAAVLRIETEAELHALRERERAAPAYTSHPALLRLRELETLGELARSGNARLYIDFDWRPTDEDN